MFSRRTRHWLRLTVAICIAASSSWAAPSGTLAQLPAKNASGESLGEEAELARATSLYDSGQYSACVDAFDRLLNPEQPRRLHSASIVENARVYHGACLIGVGRTTDAERVFREAILENPQMKTPDGLLFPESVVELFLRVREAMLDEIRRAEQKRMQDAEARANREQLLRVRERLRVEQLVAIAEKEIVIEQHQRWIATIPFGVGQFQNGSTGLGWAFLLSQTAMSGLLAGSLYMDAYYRSKSVDPSFDLDALNTGKRTARTLQMIGGYGLIGLAVVGIAEAQLSFVPERRSERKRQLPEHLKDPQTKANSRALGPSVTFTPWTGTGSSGSIVGGALTGKF